MNDQTNTVYGHEEVLVARSRLACQRRNKAFRGQLSDECHAALVEETYNKRPGSVDDVAETAYFLASSGARHITGQTINVNGGAYTTR
ncbi:SDR family oxidoreductase [Streptomyces sp. NPDC046821]|uniref:SDR family oxidoreductase n=1 Tax=Streptomyces sp. NPDC046821 TaxID=3154702 RepID=UPI00340F9EF4